MSVRLSLVVVLATIIAGCGGSQDKPAEPTANRPAVQRQSPAPESIASKPAADPPSPSVGEEPPDEPAATDEGPARTWTDAAGNLLARGEFVDVIDGKVCLQTADGAGTVIPLERLSPADREYVKSQSPELPVDPSPELPEVPDWDEPAEQDPIPTTASSTPTILPSQRVVIPFDFVSKFDEGRYGQMVGAY